MNFSHRDTGAAEYRIQQLFQVFASDQSFAFKHGFVILLFMFLVHLRMTYLPLSILVVLLATYHEWTLNIRDGTSTIRYTVLGVLIPWLVTFMYRLSKRRMLMHNLPGVPHSILFGHISTMAKESPNFPRDVHGQVLFNYIADEYNLRQYGLFYVDVYPIQHESMIIVTSPEVAAQATQITSYPKHPAFKRDFGQALGHRALVLQEGVDWKVLRTMFSPGFSPTNLFSMVPMMVDETEIFASRLSASAAAGGFVRSLDSFAAALTIDIIGQALLGLKFNSQNNSNSMVTSIIKASRLVRYLSNFSVDRLNFWRILKLRYYEAVSNSNLNKLMRAKWAELAASPENIAKSHALFNIAMAKHFKTRGKQLDHLTKDFLDLLRDSTKGFIFAGHDTTSSVLAHAFYELSRHPKILEEVRAEHENILGPDLAETAKRLKEEPTVTNALPLTTAIIREVMRLYPPASTIRLAPKESHLIGKDGKHYPTAGCMIWVASSIIMRDPESFPSPHSFIPHRFLPDKSPFPPIPQNAYRPFEKGLRDCIGQELAMLELRVVLALTVRRFDFREAYRELDRRLGRKGTEFKHCEKLGGRAYQILLTAAKPKDGLPVWVTERKRDK